MRMTFVHDSRKTEFAEGTHNARGKRRHVHAVFALVFMLSSTTAFAQRGGGMGGGGMGGMGGGRGGGGGMGRGGGGGSDRAESASKKIKSDFEASDPVQFLLKRDKPLKLDKTQKDSLKALHKELDAFEKPLFADVEKLFTDAEKNREAARDSAGAPAGGGRGGRFMPNGVRELVAKLGDAQLAFKDRARAKLNASQLHIADSLKVIYDSELQEKEAKQRSARGRRNGRRWYG